MTSTVEPGRAFVPRVVAGGVVIPERSPRGGGDPKYSAGSMLPRLAFLSVGLTGIAGWLGFPRLLMSVGPVAAATVAATLAQAVRRSRRAAEAKGLRAAHPDQPWRWGHAWDERGARDDTGGRAARSILWGLVWSLFAVPATVMAFAALLAGDLRMRLAALPFVLIALGADVVLLHLFKPGVYLIARRLKYGRGIALFESFPFRRGSTLEMHVEAPCELPQHAVVTATLRCVQERYVTRSTREGSTALYCFEVYRDTAPAELIDVGAGMRALRVSFAVAADAPTTDLSSRPCRYWEVEVEARADGVDYRARFLVPVY